MKKKHDKARRSGRGKNDAPRSSRSQLTLRKQASDEDLRPQMSATELIALRDVFWNNVAQEMLNGLSVLSQQHPEMFDGRFAVLTHGGERIPIARVDPIFACSLPFDKAEKRMSMAVQSTVFRVQTPAGEVFTIPLHEIRGLHALTPELIAKMQQALGEEGASSNGETGEGSTSKPFGLAAFAALPKKPLGPAPSEPGE